MDFSAVVDSNAMSKPGKVLRFGGPGGVVEVPQEDAPVGEPAKTASDPVAIAHQLDELAGNALIAQNRLTNLVDATQCATMVQNLIERYAALSTRFAALYDRLAKLTARPDDGASLIQDAGSTGLEVQGFIEAVEGLVNKYPHPALPVAAGAAGPTAAGTAGLGATPAAAPPARDMKPFMILGGLAVLLAGGGYLIWSQKQKQERAASRASRSFGALPARAARKPKLKASKR